MCLFFSPAPTVALLCPTSLFAIRRMAIVQVAGWGVSKQRAITERNGRILRRMRRNEFKKLGEAGERREKYRRRPPARQFAKLPSDQAISRN